MLSSEEMKNPLGWKVSQLHLDLGNNAHLTTPVMDGLLQKTSIYEVLSWFLKNVRAEPMWFPAPCTNAG